MLPLLSEFLMLSDEPAVLARGGRVLQLNDSASSILGSDCVGRSLRQLFGEELASAQAPNFVASVTLQGQPRTVRVSRMEGMQLIFLSRDDRDLAVINDAMLTQMRGCMMNLSLCAERGRLHAEELADPELGACFTAITRQYYLLNRFLSNCSIVYSLLRGELPMALATVDLAGLCRSTAETLSLLLPGPEFRVSAPPVLLLQADRALLETLLLNLLSNALMHAKGLTMLSVTLTETEQSVILSVSDDGCGIPAEQLHSVFSRYRYGFDISAARGGAGLGLSVVRGIAARHGGTLLLESREGQGTSVRVSLSRALGGGLLHARAEESVCGMNALLTGLADCLPEACFGPLYLD